MLQKLVATFIRRVRQQAGAYGGEGEENAADNCCRSNCCCSNTVPAIPCCTNIYAAGNYSTAHVFRALGHWYSSCKSLFTAPISLLLAQHHRN